MFWDEVKKLYPDKWIIYISVKEQMKNKLFEEEKLIVIEALDDINKAYRYFCRLNRNNNRNVIRIANTGEKELKFEFKKNSNSYKFKRAY
ncbi:hypothetical protein [uncultured Clostridium sp.]|uniref:hypothetical protein n=1 Tax=uncultured Clostridium sp. TaxID=59620 RepID=UPI0025D67E23|nr:hypothetical protein [uncultured Clostridium sp.]